MMFRLISFIFCLLTPLFLQAKSLTLTMGLKNATPGQYLVICQDRMATLFRVADKRESSLVFEEISIPLKTFVTIKPSANFNFRNWYENEAPANTSWTFSEIDCENGSLIRSYSLTQQKWLVTKNLNPFLSTLLTLTFEELPESRRRKAGPPPGAGKPDLRPIWQPVFCVEGEPIMKSSFTAYLACWPNDASEMANRNIVIYLPSHPETHSSPTFLPYFLEVGGWSVGRPKIQVIDSGTSLSGRCSLPF